MLHWVLYWVKNSERTASCRVLRLHADNCSGHYKNRFVLFFLLYLVQIQEFDAVELCFMVAGHTKNECDSSFGHVKSMYRSRDVFSPIDVMKVISESSRSVKCIPSSDVRWVQWRRVLEQGLKIPSNFKITQYHCLRFEKGLPGIISAKRLQGSEATKFDFTRNRSAVRNQIGAIIHGNSLKHEYAGKLVSLSNIKSAHHGDWRSYLKKSILSLLFKGDEKFEDDFFSNGVARTELHGIFPM